MKTLEMWLFGSLVLIALYLFLKDAGAANTVIKGLSDANVSAIKALQGR